MVRSYADRILEMAAGELAKEEFVKLSKEMAFAIRDVLEHLFASGNETLAKSLKAEMIGVLKQVRFVETFTAEQAVTMQAEVITLSERLLSIS